MVTLTYPHIGNTGINTEDVESDQIYAAGLIIKNLPILASNFRSTCSLSEYLKAEKVVGIAGIDTRKLTRILREGGAQNGAILAEEQPGREIDPEQAIALARAFPGLNGLDLARTVSVKEAYEWRETTWKLGHGFGQQNTPRYHVVAFDYGIKRNILRMLAERGCKVTVLPAQTSAAEALAYHPDGIFLSNGPGDPAPCEYAIEASRLLIERGVPTFGICIGHQTRSTWSEA